MMTMMKPGSVGLYFAALTLAAGIAPAQVIENMDISFLFGAAPLKSATLPGGLSLSSSTGFASHVGYGYKFLRTRAGGWWVDVPMSFGFDGKPSANLPGPVNTSWYAMTPGLRLMTPLSERLSLLAVGGAGFGAFHYFPVQGSRAGYEGVTHGVIELGGGADFRLSQHLSLRVEVRDFMTGRGLSGVEGRQRVQFLGGLSAHY